jgi:hypothetical protein
MKPLRRFLPLILLPTLALFSTARAAAETDSPVETVKAIYHTAYAHFGFDADIVKTYKPWLTPDLYSRLLKKANQPVAKGDAPDIEGDVIFDAQDVPNKYVVGKATTDSTKAKVDVSLTYSGEPDKRHFTVQLQQIDGAWKVSDIDYGKDGKLSDLLK